MSPRKRQRRLKSNATMTQQEPEKRGKQNLLDYPLEVLLEVLQHLQPVEILYLARTTKPLRAFLFDRNRTHQIWKTAIGNVRGMPPCPDHLSEPAYTHLAFDPVCHGCYGQCKVVEWELRMRCCKKCVKKLTMPFPGKPLDPKCQEAHPVLPISTGYYTLRECDMVVMSASLSPTPLYRRSDWQTLRERARHSKLDNSSFTTTEKELWRPIVEHSRLCKKWDYKRLEEEGVRLELVRQERGDVIKKILKEQGWTDDIFYSEPFFRLPVVRKPEPLTPDEWSKISPKLIASLPKVRLTYIAEVYSWRFQRFAIELDNRSHRYGNAHPRAIDIFLHPDIRRVIESDIAKEVGSLQLQSVLFNLVQRWNREATDELILFAKKELGPTSDVDQANIVFWCSRCKGHIGLDAALSHKHLYPERTAARKGLLVRWPESRLYEEVGKEVYGSHCRRLGVLRVDVEATKTMDSLAKALGGKLYLLSRC